VKLRWSNNSWGRVGAVAIAALILTFGITALASADPYDPATGTVTVMANGGTIYEDHTTTAQTVSGGGATVASLSLPAGRYQVIGKTWVEDKSAEANFVQCGLTGLVTNDNGRATLVAGGFSTVTSTGVTNLTSSGTVTLFCNASASAEASFTVLTATTVSAINAQ
jgi:hypothetical protein